MPTRSESNRSSEFGVGPAPARRSVFANYKPGREDASSGIDTPVRPAPTGGEQAIRGDGRSEPGTTTLQSSIDTAIARAFVFRFLAKAFEDPEADGWDWLTGSDTKSALWAAVSTLTPIPSDALGASASLLIDSLNRELFESFHSDYITCFGHTVRGDCPMNEIEYGDLKADPLFQPHRLADLGAFYAAFGLELAPEAAQRQDHISLELEFLAVLAAKEAYAWEHQFDEEQIALVREAQKKFLREHLGRWTPAFTRRLSRMAGAGALGALANFTREFIAHDCARFHVTPGSEDLLLRPIDEASEALCASCGITNLPPGATRSAVPL